MDPDIRYAKSGDINIAYTSIGEGDLDALLMLPWGSNLEVLLEYPAVERGVIGGRKPPHRWSMSTR